MNGIRFLLLLCVCYVVIVKCEIVLLPEIEQYDNVRPVSLLGNNGTSNEARQVLSTVYQTVNKYYCSLDSIIEGSHLMLYGAKGWTFPVQDVNLTLKYPPENNEASEKFIFNDENMTDDFEDYIITGFKVILYIDGPGSEGYIYDGGVLQENITLSFVSSQLTSLSYEFWLYGVNKDAPGLVELTSNYRLC